MTFMNLALAKLYTSALTYYDIPVNLATISDIILLSHIHNYSYLLLIIRFYK